MTVFRLGGWLEKRGLEPELERRLVAGFSSPPERNSTFSSTVAKAVGAKDFESAAAKGGSCGTGGALGTAPESDGGSVAAVVDGVAAISRVVTSMRLRMIWTG